MAFFIDSELSAPIRLLKRLSLRPLPKPDFLSGADAPKLPKAPIGAKPAEAGPADHGEAGQFKADPIGFVLVRLSEPIGDEVSNFGLPSSLSFSSDLGLKLSLRSVLRLKRDGGGEATLDSSFENREAVGEARLFDCSKSLESRRCLPTVRDVELFVAPCD